jgi:hypothetical protein
VVKCPPNKGGNIMQNRMLSEPKKECIASIAMFRELVNHELDIYDILAEFLKYIIFFKKFQNFTALEVNNSLKELFHFSVPEIVIKAALKKIEEIEEKDNQYSLFSEIKYSEEFINKKNEIEKETQDIFNRIVSFIENKQARKLSVPDKNKVFSELYDFLLKSESRGREYAKLISLWVLQNSNNSEVKDTLNLIKEGVLVTSAFEYSPNEYRNKSWDTSLTLYYDVENLFSLEGLNGEPYYSLANDLYELVKTCNKKSKKQLIKLEYFSSTRHEVENYYNAAFEILRKGRRTFQSKSAMANILNGCEDPSDAQERKILFFKRLNYKGFQEYNDREYSEESYQYNIIDSKTLDDLKEQFSHCSEHELLHIQNVLNKINHLRKGKSNSFYNAGYFFVTETNAMLNVALHSRILRPDLVPLATNIEYLTERIWSKINSTFGNNKGSPQNKHYILSTEGCRV